MAEHPRIEELRRRVQKDKASIAFAQLAEEYRRAGRFDEAIETCQTGLSHHPGYLSAHVTLGRALIEVGQWQQAQEELQRVLSAAPENLAALKGLADIHYRQGERAAALEHYRRALDLAPHDPELEHLVSRIARELEPSSPAAPMAGGLSFEEAVGEFLALERTAATAAVPAPTVPREPVLEAALQPVVEPALEPFAEPIVEPFAEPLAEALVPSADFPDPACQAATEPARAEETPPPASVAEADAVLPAEADSEFLSPARAKMQVEALERWLDAILADRQKGQPPADGQA